MEIVLILLKIWSLLVLSVLACMLCWLNALTHGLARPGVRNDLQQCGVASGNLVIAT